mgnify:FL=1
MDNDIFENIISKSRMKIAVSKFEGEDVKMPKRNSAKFVATFIVAATLSGGLVYAAGSTIYEKIWKQPESYRINQNVTDEEKAKCISEEEAENIGNSYLKKIGLSDETIQSLGLTKEFLSNENVWDLTSQKATIVIDGETGKIKSVNIPTWEYEIPQNYGITREEARKVAEELLQKYRPEDDNGEYELIRLKRNNEQDEKAYIWYADFYKKYGDLINPEERISIGWVPTINGLYSLNITSKAYENNEQKISKEEAIKIATEKDQQIETNRSIKDTKAEIRIKQMNENVYLRENFKEEYEKGTLNLEKTGENTYKLKEDAVMYKTEERIRKVWCVAVIYDLDEPYYGYTYYIDSTTGEIIGGQLGNDFYSEDELRKDYNNVIEK